MKIFRRLNVDAMTLKIKKRLDAKTLGILKTMARLVMFAGSMNF